MNENQEMGLQHRIVSPFDANAICRVRRMGLIADTGLPDQDMIMSLTAADGYVTTAEYVGEIRREGIEDITYTVTYLGEPVLPSYEDEANGEGWASKLKSAWPYLAGGSCFLAAGVLGTLLWRSRRQVKLLREAQDTLQEDDFEEREEDQSE